MLRRMIASQEVSPCGGDSIDALGNIFFQNIKKERSVEPFLVKTKKITHEGLIAFVIYLLDEDEKIVFSATLTNLDINGVVVKIFKQGVKRELVYEFNEPAKSKVMRLINSQSKKYVCKHESMQAFFAEIMNILEVNF